jgi:hypothetical protein
MYGHSDRECWADGGGNVGGREAYKKSVRARANLASTDAFIDAETRPISPPLAFHNPDVDSLDTIAEEDPIEVQHSLYTVCSPELPDATPPYLEFVAASTPVVLSFISDRYFHHVPEVIAGTTW